MVAAVNVLMLTDDVVAVDVLMLTDNMTAVLIE